MLLVEYLPYLYQGEIALFIHNLARPGEARFLIILLHLLVLFIPPGTYLRVIYYGFFSTLPFFVSPPPWMWMWIVYRLGTLEPGRG
ncbi:hypothetical protein BDW74DRAFT_43584 [Aspergillus multicolor]|uniref:uncharacterized protein n=1 Tax=Aspergillus multicolor TaxID=41759 RepID=UPI003CCE2A1A